MLIPSATLEDFPAGGSAEDARSLLAGWTVLWHPKLLAQTEQTPTWYRADAPPTPDGPRVVVVPRSSLDQVPTEFRRRCEANPECRWIEGNCRSEMLDQLGLASDDAKASLRPIRFESREIATEDFYAAGYLVLQVQIMTRRLRYTSNLDELHLQSRMVAAAKCFLERDAEGCAEAMHDVFDCLSEERDHYFSTDPHLIDLSLLTPNVLDESLAAGWCETLREQAFKGDEGNGILPTPRNVLVDAAVASSIAEHAGRDDYRAFCDLLSEPSVGWAGGGLPATVNLATADLPGSNQRAVCGLDLLTDGEARGELKRGFDLALAAIGQSPQVFAQLSGQIPSDLIGTLASLGYRGVVPIDFAEGSGFGEEPKVTVGSGNQEIEALVAKPIDAADDAAFLAIGAALGESIDGGEVATALMVHWPNRVCDSFSDLCRAASWCVALGRFWTLPDYFVKGERPYHSASLETIDKGAATRLVEQIEVAGQPLAALAESFCEVIREESNRVSQGIAQIADPRLVSTSNEPVLQSTTEEESHSLATEMIRSAIGLSEPMSQQPKEVVVFNPQSAAIRHQVVLHGGAPPASESFIFKTSASAKTGAPNGCNATFDVPAFGVTRVGGTHRIPKSSLLKKITGRSKGIAEQGVLRNEFMAVTLGEESGGISGVFSASRGNRFSMRLVTGQETDSKMICRSCEILRSDAAVGTLRVVGDLVKGDGEQLAGFELRYTLRRGSRVLEIGGSMKPEPSEPETDFWANHLALRFAFAEEAAIFRPIIRDKAHGSAPRRFVAPLGVLVDEAEKQTLISGHGLPLFRKVEKRMLEMPFGTAQAPADFQVSVAFDAPEPVSLARSFLAAPMEFPITVPDSRAPETNQAWLLHCSADEVLVTGVDVTRRTDGKLAAQVRLVQTRPKTSRVRLEFCVHAEAAFREDADGINRLLEELPEDVQCDDGVVQLSLAAHEVAQLVVVFDL
ncbi:MAG: hypothetical protein AAFV88_15170 [Planctomycetota bacterium]